MKPLSLLLLLLISLPSASLDKDSLHQQKIDEITSLLKANKLKECMAKCVDATNTLKPDASGRFNFDKLGDSAREPQKKDSAEIYFDEKISDLCKNQLAAKIKKLPLKEIDSPNLAKIYFEPYNMYTALVYSEVPKNSNVYIDGRVVRHINKSTLLLSSHYGGDIFIVKHSGQREFNVGKEFSFFGKYIGKETYTTLLGERETVPVVQLVWLWRN